MSWSHDSLGADDATPAGGFGLLACKRVMASVLDEIERTLVKR